MKNVVDFKISKRKLKGLLQNMEKSAEIINLVYVSDKDPGIERIKQHRDFIYIKNQKKITDEKELLRIRKGIGSCGNDYAGNEYSCRE